MLPYRPLLRSWALAAGELWVRVAGAEPVPLLVGGRRGHRQPLVLGPAAGVRRVLRGVLLSHEIVAISMLSRRLQRPADSTALCGGDCQQ